MATRKTEAGFIHNLSPKQPCESGASTFRLLQTAGGLVNVAGFGDERFAAVDNYIKSKSHVKLTLFKPEAYENLVVNERSSALEASHQDL